MSAFSTFKLEYLELGGSNQKVANIIDGQDPKTYSYLHPLEITVTITLIFKILPQGSSTSSKGGHLFWPKVGFYQCKKLLLNHIVNLLIISEYGPQWSNSPTTPNKL